MVLLFLNMYRTDDSVAVFGAGVGASVGGNFTTAESACCVCWFDEEAFEGDEESESCYQWLACLGS